MKTNTGESLMEISNKQRVLLVFLRHFGCTFCRETLHDIQQKKVFIESNDVRIIFVHMIQPETAQRFLDIYDLRNVAHISDPSRELYDAFGLNKGSWWQVFGFKVMFRSIFTVLLNGHLLGRLQGDGFQMPGVFLFHKGNILKEFKHKSAADRPNYLDIVRCEAQPAF